MTAINGLTYQVVAGTSPSDPSAVSRRCDGKPLLAKVVAHRQARLPAADNDDFEVMCQTFVRLLLAVGEPGTA